MLDQERYKTNYLNESNYKLFEKKPYQKLNDQFLTNDSSSSYELFRTS